MLVYRTYKNNMYTVSVLFWLDTDQFYPNHLRLLCWHRGSYTINPIPLNWWYSQDKARCVFFGKYSLLWRHIGRDGVSNHQPHHFSPNCPFRRRSKKTSKFCVTGLCAGNSPVTGEFPAQMTSNAKNVSIWWRHHVYVALTAWSPSSNNL